LRRTTPIYSATGGYVGIGETISAASLNLDFRREAERFDQYAHLEDMGRFEGRRGFSRNGFGIRVRRAAAAKERR